jgi:hypothetical protein
MSELSSEQKQIKALQRRLRRVERRQQQAEQAILELDAAFRRSGLFEGSWALSLRPPETQVPGRQSADPRSTIRR